MIATGVYLRSTAKVGASKTQKFGSNAVNVTENIARHAYEGGKWFTHRDQAGLETCLAPH
jgi:hypothetical protein